MSQGGCPREGVPARKSQGWCLREGVPKRGEGVPGRGGCPREKGVSQGGFSREGRMSQGGCLRVGVPGKVFYTMKTLFFFSEAHYTHYH